jgi:hypothetical protein
MHMQHMPNGAGRVLLDIRYVLLVLLSVMLCVQSVPLWVLLLGVPGQDQFVLREHQRHSTAVVAQAILHQGQDGVLHLLWY